VKALSEDPEILLGGNDRIYGGWGNDDLYGEMGRDRVYGSDGNDLIDGGNNGDVYYGGNGADTFVLETSYGLNWIQDFQLDTDSLQLPDPISYGSLEISQHRSRTLIGSEQDPIIAVLENVNVCQLDADSFCHGSYCHGLTLFEAGFPQSRCYYSLRKIKTQFLFRSSPEFEQLTSLTQF